MKIARDDYVQMTMAAIDGGDFHMTFNNEEKEWRNKTKTK